MHSTDLHTTSSITYIKYLFLAKSKMHTKNLNENLHI
jgi:hypothetical protein